MSNGVKLFSSPSRLDRFEMPGLKANIGKSLRAAERELEEAQYDGRMLDLTYANTNRFPPPEWTLDEFTRAAAGGGMTYTPHAGDADVRSAVAENISTVFGIETATDEVILTPGTQAALFASLGAVVEHGDRVVLGDPEYLSTERMLHYFGADVIHVPLYRDDAGTASFDRDALRNAFANSPALFVFSNPNNPTGAVHSKKSLDLVAQLSREFDVPVLVDQLYCRLVYEGTDFHHLARFEGMKDRTITLAGPSKTESLSGFRIGVAVAPKEVVVRMEDILSATALRAPAYAQHLLARWLRDDHEYVRNRINEYTPLRDRAIEFFSQSRWFDITPARGSAYLFPEYRGNASDQELAIALKTRKGIVVNPGYQFGPRGHGHIRVCFAQEEADWEWALQEIDAVADALEGN